MSNVVPGGPFDIPSKPFVLGKLYSRVWQAPYTHGLTDIWRKRCNDYWEAVEQRFGLVFSECRNAWEMTPDGPVVVTYATPIAKLKGARVARPRVPETVQ